MSSTETINQEKVDQRVRQYAEKLQAIYDNRTAGDYTFHGVLAEFLYAITDNPLYPEEDK